MFIVGLDNVLVLSSSDMFFEVFSKDVEDGFLFLDMMDSSIVLSGFVVFEIEFLVKVVVVKIIFKDYVFFFVMLMLIFLIGLDEGQLVDVCVVKEKEIFELEFVVGNFNFMNLIKVEGGKESLVDLKYFVNIIRFDLEEKLLGYCSSFNIMLLLKRIMVVFFVGSCWNMDLFKQFFVSFVIFLEYSYNGNVVVFVILIVM